MKEKMMGRFICEDIGFVIGDTYLSALAIPDIKYWELDFPSAWNFNFRFFVEHELDSEWTSAKFGRAEMDYIIKKIKSLDTPTKV